MATSLVMIGSLARVDAATVAGVHRVVRAVVDEGGAVGWLVPPTTVEIEDWLQGWNLSARSGRADLVFALVENRIEALGGWRAGPSGPTGHVVELTKIMVHPESRGMGLGRLVVETLIDGAREYGAELLVLGVRGNNHGAQALYESCGFRVWGVLPNGVAVDDQRFDDVRMYRQLSLPPGAVVRGRSAGGIGGSPTRKAEPST